ncbi:MAG: thiosulfate oxidation carrier protein SoxY [Chlorobiaceae bacterium]|nr:thiosulfate oxidation carrier protein SoxY [Chlorobiaceae bacterium]
MGISRRQFIRFLGGAIVSFPVVSLLPERLLAKWNAGAFGAASMEDAVREKYGSLPIEDSSAIELTAPLVAEDGLFVPVSVASTIQGITSISFFSEKNFSPLVASFDLLPRMRPNISLRIKVAETGKVVVIAKAGERLYRASRMVVVSVGGCG